MVEELPVSTSYTRPSIPTSEVPVGEGRFILGPKNKSYKHQFANIYFVRLRQLRRFVEERVALRWKHIDPPPPLKARVLDVRKGEICQIIGTVYLDMPVKPNILEDIALDLSMPVPPPPTKIYSPEDSVYLEDESGRIKLSGGALQQITLVTGIIIGVMGQESDKSEFEVIDLEVCGMPPQAESPTGSMEVDGEAPKGEWIALLSGLDVGSKALDNHKHDIRLQLLVEYLTSELGGVSEQSEASKISRVFIAGDSLTPVDPIRDDTDNLVPPKIHRGKPRKLVTTQPHPLHVLCDYLRDMASSLPVHLMPGPNDPSGITLPQQPLPRAMFGKVKEFKSFHCETNPAWFGLDGCSILGTSGQPLDDMCKYLPDPEDGSSLRLGLLRTTLSCRHMAPTAPDTLHCYPYFAQDPFILSHTPSLYFHGNQPKFETELMEESGVRCRLLCLPRFAETGELVLFNIRTLDVKVVVLDVTGMGVPEESSG